jgi:hypothetical protein
MALRYATEIPHIFHDLVAIPAPDTGGPPISNTIGRQFLSQYFVVVDYAGAAISLLPPNTKNLPQTKCGGKRMVPQPTPAKSQYSCRVLL